MVILRQESSRRHDDNVRRLWAVYCGRVASGSGPQSIAVCDPGNGQIIGQITAAAESDTQDALLSAGQGLALWRETLAWQRADILQAVAREMVAMAPEAALTISRESGKPLAQAKREWELSVDQFVWYAEEARRIYGRIIESRVPGGRLEVHHEPVGIVAAFTARNFPVVLVARKLAPARRPVVRWCCVPPAKFPVRR